MARKIAVVIHKGGSGKTTTAKNLAAAFALKGKRTLLVDLDEQASATKGLGINPLNLEATLNDLFADPNRATASVILQTHIANLHIIPAHRGLAKTETGMALQRADPNNPDPIETLKLLIEPINNYYDFIIFDTPPSLNYMTINALAASDEVLIPAAASDGSEDGVTATWEACKRAQETYNPSLRQPRIVVTRVKRTSASGNVLNGVNGLYLANVINQLIVEATAVDEANQLKTTVVTYAPESPAAQGYIRVAEILINEQ